MSASSSERFPGRDRHRTLPLAADMLGDLLALPLLPAGGEILSTEVFVWFRALYCLAYILLLKGNESADE